MLKEVRYKTFAEAALHILVWGLLFCFPLLFSPADLAKTNYILIRSWIPLILSAVLFYSNYFLLIDKFIFRRKLWYFFLINIVLIVLSFEANDYLRDMFRETPKPDFKKFRHFRPGKEFVFYRYFFSASMTIGVSVAIKAIKKQQIEEIKRRNLENEHLKSELKGLKYQLQPHFFLNTLNNIYALIDISSDRAKETIHGLGKLMRYLLYDTNDELVILESEIGFLKNYIELMKLRLGENIDVVYRFPSDSNSKMIAPMLFIPLVENAFKHGVSANLTSFIHIEMKEESDIISFKVENSDFPKTESDMGGSGIGLNNLQKRLDLLYPKRYRWIQGKEDNKYYSELIIEL